jgi:hypothetical protein
VREWNEGEKSSQKLSWWLNGGHISVLDCKEDGLSDCRTVVEDGRLKPGVNWQSGLGMALRSG